MSPRAPQVADLDAEAAVLSAAMLDLGAFYEAQAIVRAGDFYSAQNSQLWRAIEAVEQESGRVDSVTVASWLQRRGKLASAGGTPYLAQIIDATPVVAHVAEHARIVAGHAHRRRLVDTLRVAAAEGAGDVADPFAWAQQVEERVYEAARWNRRAAEDTSLGALIPGVVELATSGPANEELTHTGLRGLDERLGGLGRGLVYVVGGRPGMGKTSLIGQIGTEVARQGRIVVEVCTEQQGQELARRKICQLADVAYGELAAGRVPPESWERVLGAAEELRRLPLAIEFMSRPTVGQIRSAVRRSVARLQRQHPGAKLGLLSIDQLQHLDSEPRRGESRETEVARLSREIAWMAGEFDCPVLLAAQLNRQVEQREDKRPRLSDLRDSGAMEQDAFSVLFPFRPEYYRRREPGAPGPTVERAEIVIAKLKNGATGVVSAEFLPRSMLYRDQRDEYAEHWAAFDEAG